MEEKNINSCISCMLEGSPPKLLKNMQDIEHVPLQEGFLEKKQQNCENPTKGLKIKKHIAEDTTICDECEKREVAQLIDKTQEAIISNDILPPRGFWEDVPKNSDLLFISQISMKDIFERKYIEQMISPTTVCKQMNDFVVMVKQILDSQDLLEDTEKILSDTNSINNINLKIPSEIFKERSITNAEICQHIDEQIQFVTLEADKGMREILEAEFSKHSDTFSKNEEEDEMLKKIGEQVQDILKIIKENQMSKPKFLEDDQNSSKQEDDKMSKVESLKNDQESTIEKKEDKILKTEKEDKILKTEKEDKILKTEFLKDDQKYSKEGKEDQKLKIEFLNDNQESSEEKYPKDLINVKLEVPVSVINRVEKTELPTSIREETKKSMNEVELKTQDAKHSQYQKSSKRYNSKNVKNYELNIPKEELSKKSRLRTLNKVLSKCIDEKDTRNIACDTRTSVDGTLEMQSSKSCKKTIKNEKKNEKLKAESVNGDQKSTKGKGKEEMIKPRSLINQESSKRNNRKNVKNVKLGIHNIESTANFTKKSFADVCKNSIRFKEINETQNVEHTEDDKRILKKDHPKNINNELKIPSESSEKYAIEDQRLDENRFNKLPQTRNLEDNQVSLNGDHSKNVNGISNLERTVVEHFSENFDKNTKKFIKAKNWSQEALRTDRETSEMQETTDSKDSNDTSDMERASNVSSTSSFVPLKLNLKERPFVLATYLVPSLSIKIFEILAEIIEEVIKRPVVLMYESRIDRLPSKEIVDMAILPADTEWNDGILLNVSFVFKNLLNIDLPLVYVDVIISSSLLPYVKDIESLRGHGCIVPNKCNRLSAAGLLFDFLQTKGEGPSFFGHTTIASSQLAVLEAVAKQHTKVGVVDGPVVYSHKFNCCDVESVAPLYGFGPLPPYRFMLNKYIKDDRITELLVPYLLNIHENKKWITKLSPYGIIRFAENFPSYYLVDDTKPTNVNLLSKK